MISRETPYKWKRNLVDHHINENDIFHFRSTNRVSCQTQSLWLENADQCRRHIKSSIPTTLTCLSSKMQKTQSLTRPTTHAAISTSHNSISSQYSQPFTFLAAPKANPIFHAANKNLFLKAPFDYRHLTSSSSFYLYFTLKLRKGTNNTKRWNTQRKHTYVTTYPR